MTLIAQRYRNIHVLVGMALIALLIGSLALSARATPITYPQFADPEFQEAWERYDRPVFYGEVSRSYTWGGQVTGGLDEAYKEGPDGKHRVQYFDKSRMEINNPNGDKNSLFFVTQGLLARDMIRGEIQEGDTTFRVAPQGPSLVPFGDLDDTQPLSPTYASFRGVLDADPTPSGRTITARISRLGVVSDDPALAQYNVTSAGVIPGTPDEAPGFNQHAIANVFLDYIQQAGEVYEGGQNVATALYSPIQYVFGFPITEPYWATVKAGGQNKVVLIQCFERRCLTYTPSNDPTFRVEMANTGLQYYEWRYRQPVPPPPPPPATTTTTTVPTTTTTTDTTTSTTTDTTTTDTTTTTTTTTVPTTTTTTTTTTAAP